MITFIAITLAVLLIVASVTNINLKQINNNKQEEIENLIKNRNYIKIELDEANRVLSGIKKTYKELNDTLESVEKKYKNTLQQNQTLLIKNNIYTKLLERIAKKPTSFLYRGSKKGALLIFNQTTEEYEFKKIGSRENYNHKFAMTINKSLTGLENSYELSLFVTKLEEGELPLEQLTNLNN